MLFVTITQFAWYMSGSREEVFQRINAYLSFDHLADGASFKRHIFLGHKYYNFRGNDFLGLIFMCGE